MHWVPDHPNERIEDGKTVIIWCLGEEPERMNPCYAHTVYAWEIMGGCYDGLLAVNPYTHQDIGWIADDWDIDDTPGITPPESSDPGLSYVMTYTFWLNDTVIWQDGLPYTAEDCEFSLLFMRDNEIPRYTSGWEKIVAVEVVTPGQGGVVKVYMSETSQFLIYDVAGMAALLPPAVWERFDGEPQNIILGYDPSTNTTKPAGAGPWFGDGVQGHPATQLYGTGQNVFEFYDPVGLYADVHRFVDYFKTTEEVQNLKTEMFHAIGDVDRDGHIWINDLSRATAAFGCMCGDPCYDADADLNGDCIVDMRDISLIAFFWGDKKEYP
jgi:hypothetical protein